MADSGQGAARHPPALPLRTRLILLGLLVLLGGLSLNLYGRTPSRPIVEFSGHALGTTWSVKLATPSLTADERSAVTRAIAERLERVDMLMSTWRDDSEIMRFNESTGVESMGLAPETAAVLEVAEGVGAASGGAFDITVGPLVEAWGFGRTPRADPPDSRQLARLRRNVGWNQLVFDPAVRTLAKRRPGVRIDLSAVAKGYAVDEIARALQKLGRKNLLVEVGGELRARGGHLDGSPWRVAIEAPDVAGRAIHRIVELRELSMATSGDYRNFYETESGRLSHTIDPRTGRPVTHPLASVTVLRADAADADAWATALQVLGPESGYTLAEERGLAAYLIVRQGDEFETRITAAFEPFLVSQEPVP